MPDHQPHIVIIGGGFGGLSAARSLRKVNARVTIIDRQNHHVFQPLLYQVATASLNPADIAAPIRHILRHQKNVNVILGDVDLIDVQSRRVEVRGTSIQYDALIVATGASHSYFGQDQWMPHAPGLKTIADALTLRRRFLMAFERAELAEDPDVRRAELTFVIVGGGPTGVELAGAFAEIARRALPRDFRHIDTTTARVILIEAGDRLLPAFLERHSIRARHDLESLGVDVWLGATVTGIDGTGVDIGEERVSTRNVVWAAGVQASSLGAQLGAPLDRLGRVKVRPDLSLPDQPDVFVIGDLAKVIDSKTGDEVPGVAPAATQMGKHVARIIRAELASSGDVGTASGERPPFRYVDKGMLATIGRARAIGTVRRFSFAGWFAWMVWLVVHIAYLIGFRNRLVVLINWAWAYIRFERGARLITPSATDEELPDRPPDPRAKIPAEPLVVTASDDL